MRVEARLLRSVTGCGPSALDELLASGLLAEDGGGWLRFRHEIARLAVAQAVPVRRGQAIHERALRFSSGEGTGQGEPGATSPIQVCGSVSAKVALKSGHSTSGS